jgi:hypothetical protein
MSDSISQADVRTLKIAEEGVLMSVVKVGADLTERSVGGTFGVARAVQNELLRMTNGGIEWVESAQGSAFKIVREIIQRADGLTLGAIDGLEGITLAVARTIRGSGEAAGEAVSRTAETLVGKRAASSKAA